MYRNSDKVLLCRFYAFCKIKTFRDALIALKDPEADTVLKNELLKACIERIDFFREKPQRTHKGKGSASPSIKSRWSDPPIELDVKLKA